MTTTVRAVAVGHLEEFDPKNDTMVAYIERAAFYMEANNEAEDKKTAMFLTTLKEYFSGPTQPGGTCQGRRQDLSCIIEPKPLVISTSIGDNKELTRLWLTMLQS